MYGPDHGSLPGCSVRKRQVSEGIDESVESGPSESTGEDPRSEDLRGYVRLIRGLIVQSISDLGDSRGSSLVQLIEFINSSQFEELCDYAGWESEWVLDVARGILSLRPSVRHALTRQSVRMLKTLASRW